MCMLPTTWIHVLMVHWYFGRHTKETSSTLWYAYVEEIQRCVVWRIGSSCSLCCMLMQHTSIKHWKTCFLHFKYGSWSNIVTPLVELWLARDTSNAKYSADKTALEKQRPPSLLNYYLASYFCLGVCKWWYPFRGVTSFIIDFLTWHMFPGVVSRVLWKANGGVGWSKPGSSQNRTETTTSYFLHYKVG